MVRKTNSNEDEFNIEEENDPTIDSILNKTKKELPSDKIDDSKITDTITDGSDSNNDVNIDDNGDVAYVDKNAAVKAKQANRQKKLVIIAIIAILLLTGVIGFIIYWNNAHNNIQVGNRYASATNASNTSTDGTRKVPEDIKKYMTDTIGKPEYYATSKSAITEDEKKEADAMAMSSAPLNASAALAGAPNDTDDMTKVQNKDGSLNDNYSYITASTVNKTIRDDIERLINPVYGQWSALQNASRIDYSNGIDKGESGDYEWQNLTDMLSNNAKSAINPNDVNNIKSVLPIYADWNKDYYGKEWSNRNADAPIIGSVKNYNCEYNIQSVYGDYILCSVSVMYQGTVNGLDDKGNATQSIKEVDKTLTIKYQINYGTSDSDRRLLIDSIQQ